MSLEIISAIATVFAAIISAGALIFAARKNQNSLISEEEEETISPDGTRHTKKRKRYKT